MPSSVLVSDGPNCYEFSIVPGFADDGSALDDEAGVGPRRGESYRSILLRALQDSPTRRALRQLAVMERGHPRDHEDPRELAEQIVRLISRGRVRARKRPRLWRPRLMLPVAQPTAMEPGTEQAPEKTWITVYLVNEEDEPVPFEDYEILFSDGEIRRGTLGQEGSAHVTGITAGVAEVSFPGLDEAAWEAAS